MAQDVFGKMAEEPFLLKEDGYLNADTDLKHIIYHPTLNVIIICTNSGVVRVLDVNSGFVLQSTCLSAQNQKEIVCRYIGGQDRLLFCDGHSIGVRSDYNGVLLLDTILQKTVKTARDEVKLELLLSEAIILKQCLTSLSIPDADYVLNEITNQIENAQKQSKKGIKAQKWNTICISISIEYLRAAINNVITELMMKSQHSPEISVASAIHERVSELLGEPVLASDRRLMASEAKRRETFVHWPHMDYKWALPDQMAQAGFYHQPNSAGDDRAMCFTCSVCLVCWERTDEPWSEHERHSPTCPFVMGEYTQNVPFSVTYATHPAVDATYRSVIVNIIGTSSVSHLIPTSNSDGLVSVFDVSGKVKRTHAFFVTQFDSHLLEKYTQDFGVPNIWTNTEEGKGNTEKHITALSLVGELSSKTLLPNNKQFPTIPVRPSIICGLTITSVHSESSSDTIIDEKLNTMDVDDSQVCTLENKCMYLVVYDFQYTKDLEADLVKENNDNSNDTMKKIYVPIEALKDLDYVNNELEHMIKHDILYQHLIPGESDEIFIPPTISTHNQHGPRVLSMELQDTEPDSAQATSLIIPPAYTFINEPISSDSTEKSISDHITELQNANLSKKLNYSRAVQCISLPEQYKKRQELTISDVIPSQCGHHVLVVLKSECDTKCSILLLYELNFTNKMVKLNEEPVLIRELNCSENPIEVTIISFLDKTHDSSLKMGTEGLLLMVCIDGAVRVIELSTLKTVSVAKLEIEKFVSAVYCNSLERLCASTQKGSLHFYALNETDNDSTEEHDDDESINITADSPGMSAQTGDSQDASEITSCFNDPPEVISLSDLKLLQQLCDFESYKGGFNPVVPPCWSEMQQAQRQRRHPQHLQKEKEQITKTWRLQTDTTTWDEHIFEITLATPTNIGHIDVNFTLHSSNIAPKVEITLLRQNASSIGHKKDFKFAVDDVVTIDQLQVTQNPVTSQEYLRAHNADILAGPIDIASCLDLTEESGCVTLTSPKLFKSRNRNLLLHIKSICNKDDLKTSTSRAKRSISTTTEYMGCDCLHELTITVFSSTHTDIPHERSQRCAMLESKTFIESLVMTAIQSQSNHVRNSALDILNWIACIRLAKSRTSNDEAPSQQLEFISCIESNLMGLLQGCLLHAGRSTSHKSVKLLNICSDGGNIIFKTATNQFDNALLNTLLELLENIYEINSSGSLHWLSILIYKVSKSSDNFKCLTAKCLQLLTDIANQLAMRSNPYHLILCSRYGLYGTPLEPELFDVDPPVPTKATSTTLTYATIVAAETVAPVADFHSMYSSNKDHLDPKDVLLNFNESRTKLKNITPNIAFRGLLETEPLHFICVSASDGTRMEKADAGTTGVIHNGCPITVTHVSTSGTKKVEIEQLFNDIDQLYAAEKSEKVVSNGAGSSHGNSIVDNVYQVLINADNLKNEDMMNVKFFSDCIVDADAIPNVEVPNKSSRCAEDILSPNKALPWQQLLVTPPQQVIVVERMHSGARRFVTLDFGQPILLTDIFLPSCAELLSISIDIWLKGEDVDIQRLILSSDISTKNLVLSDLQPPPLCRYLKITAVGRYGMSSTRCRIPIGYFYGHLIILSNEIPLEHVTNITSVTNQDLEKQLSILSMLFEDVSCRYSLACSTLKGLLQPFLICDISNIIHLNTYIDIVKDKSNCSVDNMKVFNAYQEAITYQRQLNTVRHVMYRLEEALGKKTIQSDNILENSCTDKLRSIAEVLLEMLHVVDSNLQISLPTCEILFKGFCTTQRSHIQFLAATIIDESCRKKSFWGIFLADTLAEMFSSSYTANFPQDRVFVLLAYLVKRCSERSIALDATLRVIAQTLQPLVVNNNKSLLGVSVDISLLGWLLLFISLQLDLSKNSMQNSTRWDWVTGEMAGKLNDTANCSYRKKLHKRFLQYKQQLDNIDYSQKSVQSSAQALSVLSTQAQTLTEKLEQALKGPDGIFTKLKNIKKKDSKCPVDISLAATKQQIGKRRREVVSDSTTEKSTQISDPQFIDPTHSLAVVKGLLTLVLSIDHSCSADVFVLSCKVIAKLIKLSNFALDEYLDEEKLLKLINLCIESNLPFVIHALACLLQDILDVKRVISSTESDSQAASTSWGSDILRDILRDEALCDNFEIDDSLIKEPVIKQVKPSTNNNNHLPSVYESDDSEIEDFLDEILEQGRSTLKKNPKSLPSNGSSSAMDQRLDVGVEVQAEIELRKLVLYNNTALMQNINATANVVEIDCNIPTWPDGLSVPLNTNRKNISNSTMLTSCFDMLFKNFELQSSEKIEHVLQLWLTLNCQNIDEKFNPSTMPLIPLSSESINSLITTIAWCPDLSLRTWCSALQTLTLMCNVTQGNRSENIDPEEEIDIYRMFGKTASIINHKDFVQLFIRLLSGSGIQHCERNLAGPGLCKAIHDLLIRLEMRCDVTNPSSIPGSKLKSYMLKIVYQLVQPIGPFSMKLGPLDAQCKLLQCLVSLDYNNADLSIAMSILESTGVLVLSHVSNIERIKCVNIGERLSPTTNTFTGIFASVLGGENNKQDKPVSRDILLIYLLKLLGILVQTPLPNNSTEHTVFMETDSQPTSQTDECKAEQSQQEETPRINPSVPCLADTALQHHPTIIRLCKALATCKTTSLSMIPYNYVATQNTLAEIRESGSIGDAVFNLLSALAKTTTQKQLIMVPLLMFLSQTPQLSEPLIWFIIQIIDSFDSLKSFVESGGIQILCKSIVTSTKAPNTIPPFGNIAMVMQHFIGQNYKTEASAIGVPSNTKKQQQASLENNLNLINFAPQGTIRCQTSTTAHSPEILIQGGQATHRRARAPQWSYHFYPEEAHADLTIQLPSAILLREVHIQPHQGTLATCPSAVSLEVSSDGSSRLAPACPPLPTSGMSFIRLHLPNPEVVNCVQIRLYKPRDASNIGLSQIRLLGTSVFGGAVKQTADLTEDESHCKYSLGWLRLLHHCCTLSTNTSLEKDIIAKSAEIEDLLSTCCGLLLVPTHVPYLYMGNLENVLCELSLYSRENSLQTIMILLDSRANITEPGYVFNTGNLKFLLNSPGAQSACELLYRLCVFQDQDTCHRISLLLNWVQAVAQRAVLTKNTLICSPGYISIIASILWDTKQSDINYDLEDMISLDLFNTIYNFIKLEFEHPALKHALDALMCSICYIKTSYFPILLQKLGVLIPNQSTDHGASISDDRKDSESMTDDSKRSFAYSSEWYERLVMEDIANLYLTSDILETIALVSRSPTAIQQLLDSRLPQLLNNIILDYCTGSTSKAPMCTLKNVTSILIFFSDISEEKIMRDWLGSSDGTLFWLPLLQFLCKKTMEHKSNLCSEEHTHLEEVCVRFLSKCCLCHPNNQTQLALVLCEVIVRQTNGISGFLRRLILQLLLENEKIPVSIKADETVYKNSTASHPYLPLHPAFKQTHDRVLLYLGTNTTIADILEQYVTFTSTVKTEPTNTKKETFSKLDYLKSWSSCLSVAAGVTAKDKRTKDAKNIVVTSTPILKKKRSSPNENSAGIDAVDGRAVKCLTLSEQPLPVGLTLAQILQMLEEKGICSDLTCLHLVICQYKGEDENNKLQGNLLSHVPLSSTLQVFTSMGGLALLAQHLPTIYPEMVRTSLVEKTNVDQSESDWIKIDGSDDIYEDIEEGVCSATPTKVVGCIQNVPPHSLTAFGLFLRLPGYAEVLLRDVKKALCLLRLVLGVTDDGEGTDIFQSSVADSLPTLPFEVLRKLYDTTPLSTDDGTLLRRLSITSGVVHLLLACLGIFTHQTQTNLQKDNKGTKDEKSQLYWAKGTGFGTGSTQQSWNVEQALLKQRSEEEHVTVLLQVLSSYINPGGEDTEELTSTILPPIFVELLANSALLPAISSYLRNDSVLDMARHIPLYRATLELLRAMAVSCQLVKLLLPQENKSLSISSLLKNMKTCVDTYASKLRSAQTQKTIKKTNSKLSSAKYKTKVGEQLEFMERDEGLAMLMPDIQLTATLVCSATDKLMETDSDSSKDSYLEKQLTISPEEQYMQVMQQMQFDTFEMIQEIPEGGYKFVVSYHYESNVRSAGESSHPARVKRLAQEAVTLATSLPLSHSSSVFVRCDTDRLDIMKVLITGPADTPYANGCFEFDVYFPPDYPLTPMMINLETTGHHTVRFNPNLYNDGKVCLSVLNTWHGRPEEKWNAQTSSFLQVLVSIQSLILVPEPYFNEPGYERSRGTPSGTQSSREYNANICHATVRWGMLEQLANPCPCFKDVINNHFYIKRQEILEQCEKWVKELENDNMEKRPNRTGNKRNLFTTLDSFKKVYESLKAQLAKLKPPDGVTEGETTNNSMEVDTSKAENTVLNGYETEQAEQADIDMEKMVSDMCE